MDRKIDYDRGVLINNHPGSGMDVYMYIDSPGEYLTAHNTSVPVNLAREAGYNVEQLAKDKLRKERKAQASAIIDKELAYEANTQEELVLERNGFKLVSIGMGRHNVKDPDDNTLNAHPLPKEGAVSLLNAMAGEEIKVQKK